MRTDRPISKLPSQPQWEQPGLEPQPPVPDRRDRKRYHFDNTPLRRILTPLLTGMFHLILDIKAHEIGCLPGEGGVVLAANHLTNFDVFPMQIVLPRLIFYMGKEELFRNPLLDAALRQFGGFPVYRGAGDEWAMRHALQVLEHGQVLGIFLEGSRSKGRGLRTGKTGAARLAIASGCPIVPLAINGTQHIFSNFPRRAPVTITLGPPIHAEPQESPLALTDRLMFTLADMLPKEMRGVYSERPKGFF